MAYFDSSRRWDTIREISGIEVTLESTDRNNDLCVLYLILDLFMGECADVYLRE